MQKGWIKLHRKLLNNPIFQDPYLLKLWMYCLLKASHSKHKQLVGKEIVELDEGQFIWGRIEATVELNKGTMQGDKKSESTWERNLKLLENLEILNRETNNKCTIVTIAKWAIYQDREVYNEQQMNSKRTTDEQQMNTNKNVKNVKNDKELIPYAEIVSYLNEKANKKFKHQTAKTKQLIKARWNEGNRLDDFKQVIDVCCDKWSGQIFSNGQKGDTYLQPSTLFNGKFDERLNWSRKSNVVNFGPKKTKEQIAHEQMLRETGYFE